jgi:alkanesulfonate monooxygenase SsuD/methylene tetrahydromethanopterin reductase-like flavin-dependent oxidoreductase (luciferase family)
VGTSVVLGFTRSPMITALEALDLDELCGGRFVLGIGSGVQRLNEDWHNVAFGKPVPHMRETVRNIRLFWGTCTSGAPIEAEGAFEPMRIRGYERPFLVPNADIPVYLAAMGPLMTRLAGEIGQGWISHELCSPSYLRDRILPDLEAGVARATDKLPADLDVVASACCSVSGDPVLARRRAAGLVGFYATVRTYADFFDFHGLADDQQVVIDAFRAGAGADHLADAVSDAMVDALTMSGTRDDVASGIAAYEGLASSVKLSPPTHGLPAEDTRAAQEEILRLIGDLTGASR